VVKGFEILPVILPDGAVSLTSQPPVSPLGKGVLPDNGVVLPSKPGFSNLEPCAGSLATAVRDMAKISGYPSPEFCQSAKTVRQSAKPFCHMAKGFCRMAKGFFHRAKILFHMVQRWIVS
jgi:hypothetical protein